jgi:DNA-binding SARP family transcriptional activator
MDSGPSVEVRLLGPPRLVRDGAPVGGPRGRKGWAVLARLALSSRPLARSELATLLFPDAEDPLGALRWTLAEVRRALGREDLFRGDPLELPDGLPIDLRLLAGETGEAVRVSEDAGELLAGWDFPGCPEFETWLATERRRAEARVEAHLRGAAMEHLAAGDLEAAIRLAGRAVALNPLDEALQELLIRSLARSGDRAGAEEQLRRSERLLAESLGVAPSPALRAAVEDGPIARRAPAPVSPTTANVLIESGKAAIDAGAFDAGIQTLRRAISVCEGGQRATALLRLGAALAHALRGRDEEGAVHLHEAAQLARRTGDVGVAVAALRELAFIDIQAGRVATADARLREGAQLAGDDDQLRCGILAMEGTFLSDRDRQPEAMRALQASIDAAERVGDRRQAIWSRALLGRSALLTGDLAVAAQLFAESIEGSRRERWRAFLPFPMAMGAEASLARGEPPERVARLLEESFALGCELGDPCWEGLGASGLARVALAGGDRTGAWEQVQDAYRRTVRHPDRYVWIEAWVLLAVIDIAHLSGRNSEGNTARATLADLAVRTEQPYMLSRLAQLGPVRQARTP